MAMLRLSVAAALLLSYAPACVNAHGAMIFPAPRNAIDSTIPGMVRAISLVQIQSAPAAKALGQAEGSFWRG